MQCGPVKIYSTSAPPRLRYISEIILGDILGLKWEIVTDKRKLGKHPVINYSSENLAGSFTIRPASILFEKGVVVKNLAMSSWKELPVFFLTETESDLPFDIFAASFFLISRYEEYLEFTADKYGRFPSSASLAFKEGFLRRPIVDLWARELAKAFLRRFPTITFKRNDYKALLTIDTDQPFAYQGKNIFRSIGGLLHDKNGSPVNVTDRYRIMAGNEKDPFDVFDYILENIEKSKSDARFFFPVGNYSKYDKNPSWKNEEYRELIYKIADKYMIGLHPSYVAGGDGELINTEVQRLGSILQKEITLSRFHYLRLRMPGSYNNIIGAGISEDYSMGYPDQPGFRAGISRPYYFYDIKADKQTNLKLIPFQLMDGTLFDYAKLDQEEAKALISELINESKNVGGLFVSIWHNTSLLDNEQWRGWREVFEFVIKNQMP
jgi:Family of unknown function (DUF7033)